MMHCIDFTGSVLLLDCFQKNCFEQLSFLFEINLFGCHILMNFAGVLFAHTRKHNTVHLLMKYK